MVRHGGNINTYLNNVKKGVGTKCMFNKTSKNTLSYHTRQSNIKTPMVFLQLLYSKPYNLKKLQTIYGQSNECRLSNAKITQKR